MSLTRLFGGAALAVTFSLALTGCDQDIPPASTEPVNNGRVQVDVLFTDKDGYTVKRFEDNGRYRYYVTPGPARMEYSVRSGKTTRPESIDTAGAR